MPAGTPPEAVKNAAREFAAEQFQGHQYAFALHTDSERPDEPAHPHVHLCVLIRDEYGQRLNPRKMICSNGGCDLLKRCANKACLAQLLVASTEE